MRPTVWALMVKKNPRLHRLFAIEKSRVKERRRIDRGGQGSGKRGKRWEVAREDSGLRNREVGSAKVESITIRNHQPVGPATGGKSNYLTRVPAMELRPKKRGGGENREGTESTGGERN